MRTRFPTIALLLLPLALLAGCGDDDGAPSRVDDLRAEFTAEEAEILGTEDEATVRLIGLEFTSESSHSITGPSFDILEKFTRVYTIFPDHTYTVEVHTDERGDSEDNLRFSQVRAEAVRESLLESAGRPANGVTAEGMGEDHPIEQGSTQAAWDRNRRVEVVIRRAP